MCTMNEMIVLKKTSLITFILHLVRPNVMLVILIVGQSCVKRVQRKLWQAIVFGELASPSAAEGRAHAPVRAERRCPDMSGAARAVQYPPRRQGKRRRTHKEAALSPFVFQGVRVLLLSLRSGISAC